MKLLWEQDMVNSEAQMSWKVAAGGALWHAVSNVLVGYDYCFLCRVILYADWKKKRLLRMMF